MSISDWKMLFHRNHYAMICYSRSVHIYNFCIGIQKQTGGSVIKTRNRLRFKAHFQIGLLQLNEFFKFVQTWIGSQ